MVSDTPPESAVTAAEPGRRAVGVIVVYPDATLRAVILSGDDASVFSDIRRLVGGPVIELIINDHDGRAALGWVEEGNAHQRSAMNPIASRLLDQTVTGPMVITGLGRGEAACVTSVHDGLRAALESMAAEQHHQHDRHS